jgi:hypothetical protein
MLLRTLLVGTSFVGLLAGQGDGATAAASERARLAERPGAADYVLEPGTRVPLSMINSVSTKHTLVGDRIYLETVFPVMSEGRIVIPPGSYVAGTVTSLKRPGRVKGRGELYVRFDSLTLPNGVTRDFRARIGSLDGRANEELDREEGTIRSEGNKAGNVRTVGESAAAGASAGTIAGAIGGNTGMGAGIGAAAGATAGLVGVLLTRGPEAVLAKGTTLEMILDREVSFTVEELNFGNAYRPPSKDDDAGPLPSQKSGSKVPVPGSRLPL